jgi:inositol hexakisphosphate/diphosphoinositol-pentakisphosphate kinase
LQVYTVGPDYAHAEARKSPALDGRVERVDNGKEKRYPVILTAEEKLIARKVCMAFKQTVCGFDLLRANGRSYVCDVNGFSFVKNTEKYYDDCSQILLEMILSKTAPHYIKNSVPLSEPPSLQTVPVPIAAVTASSMELRCVIGVIRHADRTPKQKMKMIVTHTYFFDLFDEWDGYSRGSVKIKKPKNLQTIMDIACKLLDQVEREGEEEAGLDEKIHKLQQLKSVLKMYDQFSGINRKIQLKLVHKGLDGEPLKRYPSLLLILKWGGEVTPSGEKHAEKLGKAFRCMYPGGEGEYSSLPGSGFLRLHSTYRHDLKVYASDEGRVQLTAAAFTKGLLALEGNLASILVHLVKRDQNATMMLDTSNESSEQLHKVKQTLHHCLKADNDFDHFSIQQLAPTRSPPLLEAMKYTHNPYKACSSLHQLIYSLLDHLHVMAENNPHC